MKQKRFFYKNTSSGFTLVEVMVSLMIFMIVVVAAIGSLYSVNSASRKAQAMRTVLDNLTFATESMSRTIRTANSVTCGGIVAPGNPNCPYATLSPSEELLVDSTLGTNALVHYRLNKTSGRGVIQKRVSPAPEWVDLTAPEIDIKVLDFYVEGADASDLIQPSVKVFIQGEATAGTEITPFALQTFISLRATD